MILFRSSGNSRLMTNPGEDYSNEDASAWLASVAWLDVFIKPAREFCNGRNEMRPPLPNPDHRDNKKNSRSQAEERSAERAISNQANYTEQRLNDHYADV